MPGKPLLKLGEKTIINHVYDRCKQMNVSDIIVLSDDNRIYDEVINFGGKYEIITENCLNGTERIIKYLNKIGYSCEASNKLLLFKVIKAFQRHFRKELINGIIDKECFFIAQNLSKKL